MRIVRLGLTLFFVALFGLLILSLLANTLSFSKSPRVSDYALVTPHAPSDQLFDQLTELGAAIQEEVPNSDLPSELIQVLQNGRVLADLMILYRQGYEGSFLIEGKACRTTVSMRPDEPFPNFEPIRNLLRLLMAKMQTQVDSGESIETSNALESYLAICRFLIQNPTLVELMVGLHHLDNLYYFLLQNNLPVSPGLFPSNEEITIGLRQAVYMESLLMENLFDSSDGSGYFHNEAQRWGWKLLMNREASQRYVHDQFISTLAHLEQGTPVPEFEQKVFNKWNPLHYFFNPVGRILIDIGRPNLLPSQLRVYVSIWKRDALLFHQAISQKPANDEPNYDALLSSLNLRNPLHKKDYSLTSEGKLDVLDLKDPLWDAIGENARVELAPFPLLAPSPKEKKPSPDH